MIQIDGSYGEGGGQIIRTALSLAAITGQPVEVNNVRANRSKPGLQAQHLAAVNAASDLCAAKLTGAEIGSTSFQFFPTDDVQGGDYLFDIGTAGSAPLVAQTVIIPLALTGRPCTIVVTGGTHNPMAPSSDYLEHVYAVAMREMGIIMSVASPRAGFYPKGGGAVEIELTGSETLFPIQRTDRGPQRRLEAIVTTSRLPDSLFNRARKVLEERLPGINVRYEQKESNGPGAAVVIIADYAGGQAGFTGLGELKKQMEIVAEEAVAQYLAWSSLSDATDEHLADQLVLPAIFADGASTWTTPVVTDHLRTVLWLVNQFVPIEYELGEIVKVSPGTGQTTVVQPDRSL
jgi:RNA 3'-terminal phosphate cyclase (ATP)